MNTCKENFLAGFLDYIQSASANRKQEESYEMQSADTFFFGHLHLEIKVRQSRFTSASLVFLDQIVYLVYFLLCAAAQLY